MPFDSISIVVPLYKEEANVLLLVEKIHQALQDSTYDWELICVDDGSTDATVERLYEAQDIWGEHVRILEMQRNFGQTASMQAGIDAARGDYIVTMDGDLQNDPSDIPAMITMLEQRDLDMLQGWRQNRQDKLLLRKFPSLLANKLITRVTRVKLHDYGCSLKVYRANIIKQVRLFGEMHRFIPVWVAAVTKPERIGEMPVKHHARQHGESKYGLSRTFRVVLDLLSVFFFLKFSDRPGHFFGYIGLVIGLAGSLIMSWLAVVKFGLGEDVGGRPLFFIGILLIVASIQFITTGVLAEMLARVFFRSSNTKAYTLRHSVAVAADKSWFQLDTAHATKKAS